MPEQSTTISSHSELLYLVEKTLPGSTKSDDLMLRMYFQVAYEKRRKEGQSMLPPLDDFPYLLERHTVLSDHMTEEMITRYFELFPDVYCFLRFGVPGTVKDFSLFTEICLEAGFSIQSILPEFIIQIILSIRENENLSDEDLSANINNLIVRTVHLNKLSPTNFGLLRKALQGYGLKYSDKAIKPNLRFPNATSEASVAVNLVKNELKVNKIKDQMAICSAFYLDRNPTPNKLYSLFDFGKISQYLEDKSPLFIKSLLEELCRHLQKTTPEHVLSTFQQTKKEYKSQGGDTTRTTSILLECGLVYEIFSQSLSPNDCILVACPSSSFIRKWTSDRLLSGLTTRFIVPSDEEKSLLECYYGRTRYASKNDSISFSTIDEIVENKDSLKDFNRILILALDYENSGYYNPSSRHRLYELAYLFASSNRKQTVFCLSSDEGFQRNGYFSRSFIANGLEIQRLVDLPNSVDNAGKSKKKNLWIGILHEQKKPASCYKTTKKNGFLFIGREPEEYKIDFHDYLSDGGKTDIFTFAKESAKKKPIRERNAPESYKFSEDIMFGYSISSDHKHPNSKRVTAYLKTDQKRFFFVDDENERSVLIRDYTVAYGMKAEEEIPDWLENDYPYLHIDKGKLDEKTYYIQDRISEVLRKQLAGFDICLKSFLYLYADLFRELHKPEYEFLKKFAKDSEIGNIPMKLVSREQVAQRIGEMHSSRPESTQKSLVNRAFELAVLAKVLQYNPLSSGGSSGKESPRNLINLKSALATKTFTREQFRRFFGLALERLGISPEELKQNRSNIVKTAKPDYGVLGVLIQMLTGIESKALVVLKWNDFHKISGYDVHQLQVFKHYIRKRDEDDQPWEICKADTKIRNVPCSKILADIISIIKNRTGALSDDKYILRDSRNEPLKPDAINRTFKELMKEMDLERVAEQSIQEEAVDFSDYRGSFLIENFRFVASDIAGLQADEIAYLLGNTPVTTFGTYYCDYKNPASQYMLQTKLNRISALLLNNQSFSTPRPIELLNERTFEQTDSTYPLQLNFRVENNTDEDCDVEIESEYGVSVFAGDESNA